MKATLEHLVQCCYGDDRPGCPILDTLAAENAAAPAVAKISKGASTGGLRPGRTPSGTRS